jgi:Zn-dependent peptidase ImmA (M78 family)
MSAESEGRARADAYRDQHHLGYQPLGDLVALIEQLEGIDVAIIPVDNPDAHGLSMSDTKTGVVRIAAACTLNPMRQRSTLAHELAHVLFQDHSDPDLDGWGGPSPVESRADAFARHLLVPRAGLVAVLGEPRDAPVTEVILSGMVQRFQASPQIVAIQLAQAGYITEEQKQQWMASSASRLAARYGWAEQYKTLQQESNAHRSPQRLLARATEGYLLNALSVALSGGARPDPPNAASATPRGVRLSRPATGPAGTGMVRLLGAGRCGRRRPR